MIIEVMPISLGELLYSIATPNNRDLDILFISLCL